MLRANATTLCYPNRVERAVLSGGDWQEHFPVTFMGDPIFAKSSRSVDTEAEFNITFTKSYPIGMVALANHNMTSAAEIRIRWYFDEAQTELSYDTDWINVWPAVYATSQLEWEDNNFWFGTFDDEQIENFTSLFTHFRIDGVQVIRSINVQLRDAGNPDNYIRIGRAFTSDVYQPRRGAQYGIGYGFSIGTTFETADNRAMTEYADSKIPKRTVNFTLKTLNEEEAFTKIFNLQRSQGLHREVLYTENPVPTVEGFQKTFIGRMQDVNPLSHYTYQTYENTLSLLEIL